jgi:S-DNA-T family DNA segregation ATPase FtsK/SpoIIIE
VPQPFQRPSLGATSGAKDEPKDSEKEEMPIRGLTSPVVTHRSTAPSASAPRIVSMGDEEGETERKKTNEVPAPPPSARNAGVLSRSTDGADDAPPPPPKPKFTKKEWKMPDFSQLLVSGQDQELDHSFLINRAKIIQDTLESFGAPGRVVEVRTGPVITQFGVEPDYILARGKKSRVKVGAIAALDKDLQLALGAKSIRIEAPVPGKGYVGIEVPNEHSSIVRLRNVMESPEFKKITGPLAIALGESVDGTPVAGDLSVMPHLLIAGTTGSGKSVCVNSIITSLLLRNQPQHMKFIMVDPKRVELTQYNGIPHLVSPVVTELERIVSVLKWVTREMDERYRRFSAAGARNIEDFNRHLRQGDEFMPYIVVIIDELADLMMLAPDETEKVITRIAALARATGIHLVIATQRPSVDVVTGLIKANFPARIAFAVAGGVDSRVILDQPGAERLLGRGDMLYMSGDSPAPVRLQGVFVGDTEINNITRFWRSQMTEEDLIAASRPLPSAFADDTRDAVRDPRDSIGTGTAWNPSVTGRGMPQQQPARPQQAFWDREVTGQGSMVQSMRREDDDDDFEDGDDAMYNEAVDMVRRLGKASVSLLQRRLRIGYTRAARLIDLMEERGVVGPASEGSKPRDVLTTKE